MAKLAANVKIWLGIDKFENLVNIINHNGGVLKSFKKFFYQDDLKIGTLVGVDSFGNKYFENNQYFVPRNRWVEYSEKVGLNYNASQIPPEWHRWLAHIAESPPTVEKLPRHSWMLPHQENMTGTSGAYMHHNTVRPKIQPWIPKQKKIYFWLSYPKKMIKILQLCDVKVESEQACCV